MSSKLPPLELKEEVEKYESFSESKEILFNKCKHKDTFIENGVLRCRCGAAWQGERLAELVELFNKK